MTTKLKINVFKVTILYLTMIFLSGAVLWAEPPQGRRGGPALGLFFSKSLDLSREQKVALKEILSSHKAEVETDMQAMLNAQTNYVNYLKSGGSDATQISSLIDANAAALKGLQSDGAAAFIEGYALLTDEQKEIMAGLSVEKTRGMLEGRGPGNGSGHAGNRPPFED